MSNSMTIKCDRCKKTITSGDRELEGWSSFQRHDYNDLHHSAYSFGSSIWDFCADCNDEVKNFMNGKEKKEAL